MMSRWYIFSMIVMVAISCQNELDLDLSQNRKLVLLATVEPGVPVDARISTTATTSSQAISFPENAFVTLEEDGILVDTLIYQNDPLAERTFYLGDFIPQAGSTYTLRAEVARLPDITATTTIPPKSLDFMMTPLVIDSFQLEDGRWNFFGEARIDMKSNTRSEELYHMILTYDRTYKIFDGGGTFLFEFIEELSIEHPLELQRTFLLHENGYLVKGSDLESGIIPMTFNFLFNSTEEVRKPLRMEIRKVSQEYYDFHLTVAQQEQASATAGILAPIANDVISNVENGVGIFGGYTSTIEPIFWY